MFRQLFLLLGFIVFIGYAGYSNDEIDELVNKLENEKNDSVQFTLLNKLGEIYRNIDDSIAIDYTQKAIDKAKQINLESGVADAYRMMGVHYLVFRDFKLAESYLLQSIDKFISIDSVKYAGDCFLSLGTVFTRSGEYKKAYNYLNQAQQNFEEFNDLKGVASVYRNYGILEAYQNNYGKAIEYFKKAVNINQQLDDLKSLSECYINIGVIYNWQGMHNKSIEYQKKSLDVSRQLGDSTSIAIGLLNLGVSADDQGDYERALSYYFEALEIKKRTNDKPGISTCLNNIGEVFKKKGDYAKAIEYYDKSLQIDKDLNDKNGIAICLLNIGSVHFKQSDNQKALDYYEQAFAIAKEINDRKIMAYILNSKGDIFIETKDYKKAIANFNASIDLSNEMGDISEKARSEYLLGQTYLDLRDFNQAINYFNQALKLHIELGEKLDEAQDYVAIGTCWYELGKFAKAVENGLKGTEIANSIDAKDVIHGATELLYKAYARQDNYERAFHYSLLFKQAHDSLFNLESKKQINLIENKFEVERQKQEIALQKAQLEKQNAELKQNQILQQALTGSIISITIIVVLLLIGLFNTRKKNRVIENQKTNIEEKNEELNQTNEELRVTLSTVNKQSIRLKKINREITDSIHYAKYIQKAILPKPDTLKQILKNYFVLYLPKDIVSGDFYWTTRLEGRTIIAAADCTGHGVPGGFMSMLGVSFLNDIINKEYITHPGVILRRLRKEVVQALQQKGEIGEQRDGLDIALCSIDDETLEMQFAGAHNPLYIVRAKNKVAIDGAFVHEGDNHNLYEIKGDRMPIALYEKMDRFKTIDIQLLKGDFIYLFSDGYADQFGGKLGKRFKYKSFKSQLLDNCTLPVDQQKEFLKRNFAIWKQGYEQIDDVLVMGFEIV